MKGSGSYPAVYHQAQVTTFFKYFQIFSTFSKCSSNNLLCLIIMDGEQSTLNLKIKVRMNKELIKDTEEMKLEFNQVKQKRVSTATDGNLKSTYILEPKLGEITQ